MGGGYAYGPSSESLHILIVHCMLGLFLFQRELEADLYLPGGLVDARLFEVLEASALPTLVGRTPV